MNGAAKIIYARGELSAGEVQAEIAKFWQVFDDAGSSSLDAELSAAGLDRAELGAIDRKNAITVSAGTSGADPIAVVLLVTLAPSTNRVLKDLWAKVVLPRILRRWGDDAIGEEKRGQD